MATQQANEWINRCEVVGELRSQKWRRNNATIESAFLASIGSCESGSCLLQWRAIQIASPAKANCSLHQTRLVTCEKSCVSTLGVRWIRNERGAQLKSCASLCALRAVTAHGLPRWRPVLFVHRVAFDERNQRTAPTSAS